MIATAHHTRTCIASAARPQVPQLTLSRSSVLRGATAAALLVRSRRAFAMSASLEPAYEAWVKGYKDPAKGGDLILGDCPFSHRALLTLQEKHVPFTQHYVDLMNKPDWIFQVNEKGSVPVLKDLKTGKWLASSDDIVDTLEDQYPEPALGKAASVPEAGSKVFPAFVQFLRSDDSEAAEKQAALEAQLSGLNEHLEKNGPYLKGANVSAGDMALAPKLYHLKIALKELKGWDNLGKYPNVQQYLDRIQQRDSWKATYYAPEIVVAGWKAH